MSSRKAFGRTNVFNEGVVRARVPLGSPRPGYWGQQDLVDVLAPVRHKPLPIL